MKKWLRITTAVTSFLPAIVLVIALILALVSGFIEPVRLSESARAGFDTAESGSITAMFVITFYVVPIAYIGIYLFNAIVYIAYMARALKLKEEHAVFWALALIFLNIISAPVFWLTYVKTDKRM